MTSSLDVKEVLTVKHTDPAATVGPRRCRGRWSGWASGRQDAPSWRRSWVMNSMLRPSLGVVAAIADVALVLDQGAICERGPVADVLHRPEHPYTRQLVAAAPSLIRAG